MGFQNTLTIVQLVTHHRPTGYGIFHEYDYLLNGIHERHEVDNNVVLAPEVCELRLRRYFFELFTRENVDVAPSQVVLSRGSENSEEKSL